MTDTTMGMFHIRKYIFWAMTSSRLIGNYEYFSWGPGVA